MNWLKQVLSRRRMYGELSEEIREHLEEKTEELVAGGMSREEATYAARREFGNVNLAIVYWLPLTENPEAMRTITFAIRSDRAGTQSFLNEVRQAVWAVNPNLPLASLRTMQDVYDKSVARTSFTLVMLGIAGAMAMALGMIGIYGVISYAVSQRRREIGIRLALGAQRGDVLQMVLRQGARTALVGVAIGIAAALGLTELMRSLLFGVSARDPITFAAVAALLISVAFLASYIPARRAMLVDPLVALRYERSSPLYTRKPARNPGVVKSALTPVMQGSYAPPNQNKWGGNS
jgi:cell division protein FtsX